MTLEECLKHLQDAGSRGNYQKVARVLLDGHRSGLLTANELKCWVPDTWLYLDPPTRPHGPLTVSDWVDLFRAMGFYITGPEVDLGPEPYVIYRAAPVDRAKGMSWCTHLAMANNFVPKHRLHGDYKLWSASVRMTAVLAVLYRPGDSWFVSPESNTAREVVVDPAELGSVAQVQSTAP